jgi:hypothetical protein
MKYSILVILSLAPILRKCAQEGAEQGSKKIGREVAENGSKTILHNADAIVARVAAKTAQYYARDFNNENQYVSYVDSTNTFEINNEKQK